MAVLLVKCVCPFRSAKVSCPRTFHLKTSTSFVYKKQHRKFDATKVSGQAHLLKFVTLGKKWLDHNSVIIFSADKIACRSLPWFKAWKQWCSSLVIVAAIWERVFFSTQTYLWHTLTYALGRHPVETPSFEAWWYLFVRLAGDSPFDERERADQYEKSPRT